MRRILVISTSAVYYKISNIKEKKSVEFIENGNDKIYLEDLITVVVVQIKEPNFEIIARLDSEKNRTYCSVAKKKYSKYNSHEEIENIKRIYLDDQTILLIHHFQLEQGIDRFIIANEQQDLKEFTYKYKFPNLDKFDNIFFGHVRSPNLNQFIETILDNEDELDELKINVKKTYNSNKKSANEKK